ncbi:MAG: hypothetical protein ABJE95_05240 [Byssovorax sp.]
MPPLLPHGSAHIAQWAGRAGLRYEPHPDESWFRRWEPHDTIAPPSHFLNACTWMAAPHPGHIVLVEPWYAFDDMPPLDRTVMAFASHPSLGPRAAIRGGEHFLTRVAFIESPQPPQIKLGDPTWDAHLETFAISRETAAQAFHPRLRKLLVGWKFQGHLELRPGGLVLHFAGLRPIQEDYDRLLRITRQVVEKALTPRR